MYDTYIAPCDDNKSVQQYSPLQYCISNEDPRTDKTLVVSGSARRTHKVSRNKIYICLASTEAEGHSPAARYYSTDWPIRHQRCHCWPIRNRKMIAGTWVFFLFIPGCFCVKRIMQGTAVLTSFKTFSPRGENLPWDLASEEATHAGGTSPAERERRERHVLTDWEKQREA